MIRVLLIFKSHLVCFLVLSFFINSQAKDTKFTEEYVYNASDVDSKVTSRTYALVQLKLILLEKVSVYIKRERSLKKLYSKINNSILESEDFQDKITVLSSTVIKTNILEEKWDGYKYYIKAECVLDPDYVYKELEQIAKNKQLQRELIESRKKETSALKKINELRKKLHNSKSKLEKELNNQVYQKYVSSNIFKFDLPPLHCSYTVDLNYDQKDLFIERKAFILSFIGSLRELVSQVVIPKVRSIHTNAMATGYTPIDIKCTSYFYDIKVDNFRISYHWVSTIKDGKRVFDEIEEIVEYFDSKIIVREGEIIWPDPKIINFSFIPQNDSLLYDTLPIKIDNLEITDIKFLKNHSKISCTVALKYDNSK